MKNFPPKSVDSRDWIRWDRPWLWAAIGLCAAFRIVFHGWRQWDVFLLICLSLVFGGALLYGVGMVAYVAVVPR